MEHDSGARKRLLPAVVPPGRRAGSDRRMAAIRNCVRGRMDASIRPIPRPAERIGRRSPGRFGRGSSDRPRSGQNVKSRASARFWELFRQLPAEVQDQARATYQTFILNPRHPSLQFKRAGQARRSTPCAYRATIEPLGSFRMQESSGTGLGTTKTTTDCLLDTEGPSTPRRQAV